MKTNIRIHALLLGATILGTILLAGATSHACIQQTVSEASPQDWNSSVWGSGPSAPTSGNCYETPSGFTVRTPNSITPAAFAGNSLQIDSGAVMDLKNGGETSGNAANVNLLLNGGSMIYHGGFTPNGAAVGGTIQVIADSTITEDQGQANAADIWLQSAISGSANLIVTMNANGITNSLLISGNNSAYSGNWTNNGGDIIIVGGTTNALGSGVVALTVSGSTALVFNSTNNMVVDNTITGPGYVAKSNTNTVTLSGDNAFTGSVRITNGVLQIGAGSSLSNSSTITLAGGTLDASLIGGLTLNATLDQVMDCNGTVISNLTAATANTLNFNLTSPNSNNLLTVTGSLTLSGNPTLNLTQSGFITPGNYTLITYTGGAIQGGGSFTLVPPAGSTEGYALNTATNGEVILTVTGAIYNLTWVGDGSANNWDTNSANWSGATNVFATGDNVTFNDSGSASPAINVESALVYPGSMTISNTAKYYTFGGAYGIVTAGSFTKVGTNEVDLTCPGNDFSGPISIAAGIVSIGNGGTTGSLGTGAISNNGVLQVNVSSGGAAFNAPISGSGSLNITGGGAAVGIGATNSYTGGTTIGNGCQLGISTGSALGAATSAATVLAGGRLGVVSSVGSMTVSNPLVINGTGIGGAPGAIYVNTAGNNVTWAGPVTVASAAQVRVVNINTLMNFSGTVLGTNVALECTAGNTVGDATSVMTFQNTVSLGSSGSLTADGLAVVVLNGATNVWGGGTTLSSGTLLVNGTLNGGAVAVNNSAILGGSGTIEGAVTVDGTLAPGPGNSGIGTLTASSSVTLESDGTALMNINRNNSPTASRLSANSVAYGGTLTVNNVGSTNLQAGDTFNLFASSSISGTFGTTNLPALPSTNLFWNTSLLNSGTISVGSTTPPTSTITSAVLKGTNLTFQVAASELGYNYVLEATNAITVSHAVWPPIQTNAGTGGTLNFSIPIIPGHPQMYYRISVP
jgi:fibronectin-binding autotransporter adhesin